MNDTLFISVLVPFLAHKLDAIHRHEWQLFSVIGQVGDRCCHAVVHDGRYGVMVSSFLSENVRTSGQHAGPR